MALILNVKSKMEDHSRYGMIAPKGRRVGAAYAAGFIRDMPRFVKEMAAMKRRRLGKKKQFLIPNNPTCLLTKTGKRTRLSYMPRSFNSKNRAERKAERRKSIWHNTGNPFYANISELNRIWNSM